MKCGHCGEPIFVALEFWLRSPCGVPIHEFSITAGRLECDPYREAAKSGAVIEFPQMDQKSA